MGQWPPRKISGQFSRGPGEGTRPRPTGPAAPSGRWRFMISIRHDRVKLNGDVVGERTREDDGSQKKKNPSVY